MVDVEHIPKAVDVNKFIEYTIIHHNNVPHKGKTPYYAHQKL